MNESIARMAQVVLQIAIKKRLSLLLETDHRVELSLGLTRYEGADEGHECRRDFHIDHAIRPRQAEYAADIARLEKKRVEIKMALLILKNRNDERIVAI